MSSGKSPRSFVLSRWSVDRLVAIWLAGLLGSFAAGLYLFGPQATESEPQRAAIGAASNEALPAEIAIGGGKPAARVKGP
jgi:hypothetical protein